VGGRKIGLERVNHATGSAEYMELNNDEAIMN
jgi:hypothetical protein